MENFLIIVHNNDHDIVDWNEINRALDDIINKFAERRERIVYSPKARVAKISGNIDEGVLCSYLCELASHYDVEVHVMGISMHRTWR